MLDFDQLPERVRSALWDLDNFIPNLKFAIHSDSLTKDGDFENYILLFDNGHGQAIWWSPTWNVFEPTGNTLDRESNAVARAGYPLIHRGTLKA